MVRHEEVRPLAHPDPTLNLDPACLKTVILLEKVEHIKDDTVAKQAPLFRMENPGWDLVENEFVVRYMDGMACVRTSLIPSNYMHVLSENIDNLALTFVTPLATDHHEAAAFITTFGHCRTFCI